MAPSANGLNDAALASLLELLEDCNASVSHATGLAPGMSAFVSLRLLRAL